MSATSVIGGTSPYTYSIDGVNFQTSTDFINISSGAYVLTVRDANSCEFSVNVAINDTPGPNGLTASTTETLCSAANGSITVDAVSGGVAPYTYAVDGGSFQSANSFSDLSAGAHIVSVRDVNGCILSENITINDRAGASDLTFNVTPSTCGNSDGIITIISVIGGTAPNQYSIDGGPFQSGLSFGGLSVGSYAITVRDNNGCQLTENVTVNDTGGPSGLTFTVVRANCGQSDGAITVSSVSGGVAPFEYSLDNITYQSSTAFSALAAGDYGVFVRDSNGCVFIENIAVPSDGPESFDLVANNATCSITNGTVSVTNIQGGTAPYLYSIDGTNFQSSPNFSGLAAGNYTVTIVAVS